MSKIKIVQSPEKEKEVPTEVLASSIKAIAEGVRKLRSGRLNDRALFLLIQDAAPATGGKYNHSRVGIPAIKAVLEGIDSLDKNFLRKLVK